jgi:hypothetical protein
MRLSDTRADTHFIDYQLISIKSYLLTFFNHFYYYWRFEKNEFLFLFYICQQLL